MPTISRDLSLPSTKELGNPFIATVPDSSFEIKWELGSKH